MCFVAAKNRNKINKYSLTQNLNKKKKKKEFYLGNRIPNGERGVGGGGLPLGFRHQIELSMRSIRGVEVEQVVVLPCNLQTEL